MPPDKRPRPEDDDPGTGETPSASATPETVTAHPSSPAIPQTHPSKRRRAATACHLCRSRKTKCDNRQPSCSYCLSHDFTCSYSDDVHTSLSPISARDIPNSLLLERINHAVSLLERGFLAPSHVHAAAEAPIPVPPTAAPLGQEDSSAFSDTGFGQLEISELAAKTSAYESIWQWPVLQEFSKQTPAVSLPLQSIPRPTLSLGARGNERASRLVPELEERVRALVQRFLRLIHVKNPILDAASLQKYALQTAEYGLLWDGPACLVLLSCALACVAAPYEPSPVPSSLGEHDLPDAPLPSDKADLATGDAYFEAAKRRLGTLPHSLLSVQCYYLAGLYEKFRVRPLEAWMLLQQACLQAQTYLYIKALSLAPGARHDLHQRHMEQRLYWSCVKAECEIRADLQLPVSGLLRFKYPDLFPFLSLPGPSTLGSLSDPGSDPRPEPAWPAASYDNHAPSLDNASLHPEEERSWLHYLAEISLCKIMNRILDSLYGQGEQSWLTNIGQVVLQSSACRDELLLWRSNLPPSLRFTDTALPRNEFSLFLRTRYLLCMEWLHRPFVYFLCHRPDDPPPPHILPLAEQCIQSSAAAISLISKHHRHGGLWSLLRRSCGCALLLVAAHANAAMSRYLPPHWPSTVRLSIQTMEKWQSSENDTFRMARLLRDVLQWTENRRCL